MILKDCFNLAATRTVEDQEAEASHRVLLSIEHPNSKGP